MSCSGQVNDYNNNVCQHQQQTKYSVIMQNIIIIKGQKNIININRKKYFFTNSSLTHDNKQLSNLDTKYFHFPNNHLQDYSDRFYPFVAILKDLYLLKTLKNNKYIKYKITFNDFLPT